MQKIHVQLPAAARPAYDIHIGPGLLSQLGALVRGVSPSVSCGIVSDSTVAPHYLVQAAAQLTAAGYRVIEHVIHAGEAHKTTATVAAVWDTFLNARVERSTPILALGGGVVGDLAGFVSATLLRGTPFIQVPTTLLSAVDASVGGKVGVDHPAGKNLIGAFHQPRIVITDTDTFRTLPPRELRCGLAECIKHAIIRDPSLFDFLEQNAAKILACDSPTLTLLVAKNVAIKAAIVTEDPFEHGVRALLNLGHTFGHAIENILNYAVGHGEAVALGTLAAAHLAVQLKKLTVTDQARIAALIAKVDLPTKSPGLDIDRTFAATFTDKKVAAGKLRFIIPTTIGSAEIISNVPDALVRDALASLL